VHKQLNLFPLSIIYFASLATMPEGGRNSGDDGAVEARTAKGENNLDLACCSELLRGTYQQARVRSGCAQGVKIKLTGPDTHGVLSEENCFAQAVLLKLPVAGCEQSGGEFRCRTIIQASRLHIRCVASRNMNAQNC
jgi:hypothetical protein